MVACQGVAPLCRLCIAAQAFSIHILAQDQKHLSDAFAHNETPFDTLRVVFGRAGRACIELSVWRVLIAISTGNMMGEIIQFCWGMLTIINPKKARLWSLVRGLIKAAYDR